MPRLVLAQQSAQAPGPPKTPPIVGTIKSISGDTITLAADTGAELKVLVTEEAKLLRVAPGSKDLKEASPLQLSDLQPGDRILVRGKAGDDSTTLVATSVVAMKKVEIANKQAQEREEWQRHGIGGLARSVDPAAGVVTIGTMTVAGNKDVAIQTTKATIIRRYAPGSVKFDDAKPSTLAEISAGDQVRARGAGSPDGLDFTADEILSGSFRNIAGVIASLDASAGTLTVSDLATKKNVEVKIVADSQLRKLPQPMALRIAMRLKGATPDANAPGGGARPADTPVKAAAGAPGQEGTGAPNSGIGAGGMGGPGRQGGGDLQQMLSRLPSNVLADFQKGDAVMIVATSASEYSIATAITLLGGVEPILQTSPQGQAASILTPWSLNSSPADVGTP